MPRTGQEMADALAVFGATPEVVTAAGCCVWFGGGAAATFEVALYVNPNDGYDIDIDGEWASIEQTWPAVLAYLGLEA